MTPLLSVVIPTKDRYECLVPLLEALLAWPRQDLEVVVADNSAGNERFRDWAGARQDDRLRYAHEPAAISLTANCDRAVAAARGTFTCMLGDDDGILPWALGLAEWMAAHDADAVIADRPVYRWPGVRTRLTGEVRSGELLARIPRGRLERVDPRAALTQVLARGATDMLRLPRLYHGIVRTELLRALHREHGTCFPGPSPDMASSVALCTYVRHLYWTDFPVVVTGNMARSGGGLGASRQHVGAIRAQGHLDPATERAWSPSVPRFWSGPTVWAESALKAMAAVEDPLRERLGLPYLFATCLVFHGDHKDDVTLALRQAAGPGRMARAVHRARVARDVGRVWGQRLVALGRTVAYRLGLPSFVRVTGLPTIRECLAVLQERLGGTERPWTRRPA